MKENRRSGEYGSGGGNGTRNDLDSYKVMPLARRHNSTFDKLTALLIQQEAAAGTLNPEILTAFMLAAGMQL